VDHRNKRTNNDDNDDGTTDGTTGGKGMIILGHGIGTSLTIFDELSLILIQSGFSVLRYDYFGHGYSRYIADEDNSEGGIDMWMKYTPDMFVDQLEDLIDFVSEEEKEDIVGYIGHSNGAVNGISANFRWGSAKQRKVFPKMVLVNPSVYAKKPLIARICDNIPTVLTNILQTFPGLRSMLGDAFMENTLIAFGKDPNTKKYLYPEAFQSTMDKNKRLFGRVEGVNGHPFLEAAVLGVSSYNIAGHMLSIHRNRMSKVLQMNDDENKSKTLFIWGDLDLTVPYKENIDAIRKIEEENENFTLKILNGLGHECFAEDVASIAKLAVPFLQDTK
jgi:pimeloyl-ACP methyl ester carboxylesterase